MTAKRIGALIAGMHDLLNTYEFTPFRTRFVYWTRALYDDDDDV